MRTLAPNGAGAQRSTEKITSSASGKTVATIKTDSNGVKFTEKVVDPERHWVRKVRGYAYDEAALETARRSHVQYHRIIFKTTGETRSAAHSLFVRFGVPINLGHGDQICLPDTFWHAGDQPPLDGFQPATKPTPKAPSPVGAGAQAALFEMEAE